MPGRKRRHVQSGVVSKIKVFQAPQELGEEKEINVVEEESEAPDEHSDEVETQNMEYKEVDWGECGVQLEEKEASLEFSRAQVIQHQRRTCKTHLARIVEQDEEIGNLKEAYVKLQDEYLAWQKTVGNWLGLCPIDYDSL